MIQNQLVFIKLMVWIEHLTAEKGLGELKYRKQILLYMTLESPVDTALCPSQISLGHSRLCNWQGGADAKA